MGLKTDIEKLKEAEIIFDKSKNKDTRFPLILPNNAIKTGTEIGEITETEETEYDYETIKFKSRHLYRGYPVITPYTKIETKEVKNEKCKEE